MSRRILATSGECAYEHTVPTDAQKIVLPAALRNASPPYTIQWAFRYRLADSPQGDQQYYHSCMQQSELDLDAIGYVLGNGKDVPACMYLPGAAEGGEGSVCHPREAGAVWH